ncbi:MAG: hypothetical protein ABS873_01730 [Alkalibacterium sp.]
MSRTKKIMIAVISVLGSLVAAISGLFATFFVVGKKIDQAYRPKAEEETDDQLNE